MSINLDLYKNYVESYSYKYKRIYISDEEQNKILDLATKISIKKQTEQHHQKDNKQEIKRFFTGLIGELALEKALHIPIIDWSVGDSTKYNYPDIPGYNIGIKTVEINKFPIIPIKNKYAQIICIYYPEIKAVDICGLATKDILNTYQDERYILSCLLKSRKTKTAFYGFSKLIPLDKCNLNLYKKKTYITLSYSKEKKELLSPLDYIYTFENAG